ncbi:MAG: pilus assembly protein PilP [Methylohalobius sp. ZOD2]|nr:pilus assembly protein PilP [Methylothermaceae bacterium]
MRLNKFFISIWSISLLAGCGGQDLSDLHAYVAEVKARPKGAIEPLPEIKTVETFVFDPEGLRDPFTQKKQAPPPQVAVTGNGVKPDPTRPHEVLEDFSLDSLRMVGTIEKDDLLWGLVQTADKTIYRVKTGNHMGRNYGRITHINEDRIEVVEIIPDAPGTWRERQAALALAE